MIAGGAGQDSVTYNDQASVGNLYVHTYRVVPLVLLRGPFNFEQSGFERVTLNSSKRRRLHRGLAQPRHGDVDQRLCADEGPYLRLELSEDVLSLSTTFNAVQVRF